MGNTVPRLSGEDRVRPVKAVVKAQKSFTVSIKTGNLPVDRIESIMVSPLAVLRLVIDDPVFNLHFSGGEVALEVCLVVMCVPEAPLHEREQADALRHPAVVAEGDSLHLTGVAQRNEEEHVGPQAVLFRTNPGVTHAMMTGVVFHIGLHRFPARRPDSSVIIDIEILASVIRRHIVVPVAGDTAKTCITVKAVTPGSV